MRIDIHIYIIIRIYLKISYIKDLFSNRAYYDLTVSFMQYFSFVQIHINLSDKHPKIDK